MQKASDANASSFVLERMNCVVGNAGKLLDKTLKSMLDRRATWTWNVWGVGRDSYIALRWDAY